MEMRRLLVFLIFSLPVLATASKAQSNVGELRLKVTDPSGSGVKTSIEVVCEANQFRQLYVTDGSGATTARRLPGGVCHGDVQQQGLAASPAAVESRSAMPEALP